MQTAMPLTQREADVLRLLARYRFLTRAQLEAFLFTNGRLSAQSRHVVSRRVLAALLAKSLITRTARTVGGPQGGSGAYAYYLSSAGFRLVDDRAELPRRSAPRGTFLLQHALATADVALAFLKSASAENGHELLSFETDWETAQHIGSTILVPDAQLLYATRELELHAFLEVDLGTAGSKFFRRKIDRYLALYRDGSWRKTLTLWPTVLTVTPTATRAALLKRTTEAVLTAQPDAADLRAGVEFAFTSLPQLRDHGPLAAIWHVAGCPDQHALLSNDHRA